MKEADQGGVGPGPLVCKGKMKRQTWTTAAKARRTIQPSRSKREYGKHIGFTTILAMIEGEKTCFLKTYCDLDSQLLLLSKSWTILEDAACHWLNFLTAIRESAIKQYSQGDHPRHPVLAQWTWPSNFQRFFWEENFLWPKNQKSSRTESECLVPKDEKSQRRKFGMCPVARFGIPTSWAWTSLERPSLQSVLLGA